MLDDLIEILEELDVLLQELEEQGELKELGLAKLKEVVVEALTDLQDTASEEEAE